MDFRQLEIVYSQAYSLFSSECVSIEENRKGLVFIVKLIVHYMFYRICPNSTKEEIQF